MRLRARGYTLPELMVAGALFIGLMAMAAFGMKMGLDAQDMSNRVREADVARGDVLNRLVDEMRTAAPLPVLGGGAGQIPSGVLYPDQYGQYVTNARPFQGIYTIKTTSLTGPPYEVLNRVIFTRPSMEANAAFSPSDLNQYVYVEWLVPEQAQNQVWRRVHTCGPAQPGHVLATSRWLIQPGYFTSGTGVRGSRVEDWVVAKLPGPKDTFELSIQTPRYVNPTTNQYGTETSFNTLFDRQLFKVKVTTTTVARGNDAKKTIRSQESQVRVQAGQ